MPALILGLLALLVFAGEELEDDEGFFDPFNIETIRELLEDE